MSEQVPNPASSNNEEQMPVPHDFTSLEIENVIVDTANQSGPAKDAIPGDSSPSSSMEQSKTVVIKEDKMRSWDEYVKKVSELAWSASLQLLTVAAIAQAKRLHYTSITCCLITFVLGGTLNIMSKLRNNNGPNYNHVWLVCLTMAFILITFLTSWVGVMQGV